MPKFIVASYLLSKKGSLSDIKITKDFVKPSDYLVHGSYNNDNYILTHKDSGYPTDFESIFLHARNCISPFLNINSFKMINYYNSHVKEEFLLNTNNSPIYVVLSNMFRGGYSHVFGQIIKHSDTYLVKFDFENKKYTEYNLNGEFLEETVIYSIYEKYPVAGGWIYTSKKSWDIFFIDKVVIYERMNPLREVPYYIYDFLNIGGAMTNEKSENANLVIGSFKIKLKSPKILLKDYQDKIYSIDENGNLSDVTGNVDLSDYSSFLNYAVNWKRYFKVSETDLQALMGDLNYIEIIHDCRPFIFISCNNVYNLEIGEFLYIAFSQWKTIPIISAI